jgi:hypothetical protein
MFCLLLNDFFVSKKNQSFRSSRKTAHYTNTVYSLDTLGDASKILLSSNTGLKLPVSRLVHQMEND